jgi:Cofilin/tropomyosin-type actin-binding protein
MGDEMSKRKKFLFITWIGPSVGVMKRAKMSTDKAKMKEILAVRTAQ